MEIDNEPMEVDYTGHSLQVLSPQSLLAIKSSFGLGNQADIETLKKIIDTI